MKMFDSFEPTIETCYSIICLETGCPVAVTLSLDKAISWLYYRRRDRRKTYANAMEWWTEQCAKAIAYGSYATDATYNKHEIKELPLYT